MRPTAYGANRAAQYRWNETVGHLPAQPHKDDQMKTSVHNSGINIKKTLVGEKSPAEVKSAEIIHFQAAKNNTIRQNALTEICHSLQIQAGATKAFETKTKELETAINVLEQSCIRYERIAANLSVDRLHRNAVRLQRLMSV